MKFQGKDKIDFTDAHLWAEDCRFEVTIKIKDIPLLMDFLDVFEMTFDPHQLVNIGGIEKEELVIGAQFKLKVMEPGTSNSRIVALIRMLAKLGQTIYVINDGWVVAVNENCAVLDCFPKE